MAGLVPAISISDAYRRYRHGSHPAGEKLKRWPRVWKTRLIDEGNPTWRDLYKELGGG
jgi:predicted GIY-YIG superfamily endonuclease